MIRNQPTNTLADLQGQTERIAYTNEDNGYSIAKLKIYGQRDLGKRGRARPFYLDFLLGVFDLSIICFREINRRQGIVAGDAILDRQNGCWSFGVFKKQGIVPHT